MRDSTVQPYKDFFMTLERLGMDVDNTVHMFCLHFLYFFCLCKHFLHKQVVLCLCIFFCLFTNFLQILLVHFFTIIAFVIDNFEMTMAKKKWNIFNLITLILVWFLLCLENIKCMCWFWQELRLSKFLKSKNKQIKIRTMSKKGTWSARST